MIPLHQVFMPEDIEEVIASLRETLVSGWIGEGPKVEQLEKRFSEFFGTQHVTLLNSGTSALQLALRLAGVGVGDEVITTAMTCMATNEPIVLCGATPVWADINPETGNIDPKSIAKKIRLRTKAIMLVHWGGYPCDLSEINALAQEHGLVVIEDCAHALGSKYKNQLIGTHSDFCCFSLQAIKHITSGDGGILLCNSQAAHERARSLKWFGIDREKRQQNEFGIAEWDIIEAGYKFHMNDIAACIGLAQFPYIESLLEKRLENADFYYQELDKLKRLSLLERFNDRNSAYWLFTVRVDKQVDFIQHLQANGVAASIVHSRNDQHTLFSNYNSQDLPGLDKFCREMVCIPVGPWLSPENRQQIVEIIKKESW